MAELRVRCSIQYMQQLYDTGEDRSALENLVRAWRGIQELEYYNPKSHYMIGGFHGEPFRGPGVSDPGWWGGYCSHGNVLFPTWHRAYLVRLEDALRSIPGCENVVLPFWDQLLDVQHPVPAILTSPTFELDGKTIKNPLYSYTLQRELVESVANAGNRYGKPAGYKTVRYPLSGLVGTTQDAAATEAHNANYQDDAQRSQILNQNVSAWLRGTVQITPDGKTPFPDTYSTAARYRLCLSAPNYTVFSNTTSQAAWIKQHGSDDPNYVVSLESPHNAIHLAVGGFYQRDVLNANPIVGANGDMGDNETAGFDPIFFLHHCFVDYAFWTWQRRMGKTAPGSLDVMADYAGAVVPEGEGLPYLAPGTKLDDTTPLYPFRKTDQTYYTPRDVTDVVHQLGYTYGPGSLDDMAAKPPTRELQDIAASIVAIKRVRNVNRADYPGSFVIRTYIQHPETEDKIEIGREPILSRRNIAACKNCQNTLDVESLVPIYAGMLDALKLKKLPRVWAEIHTHDNLSLCEPELGRGQGPIVDDLADDASDDA